MDAFVIHSGADKDLVSLKLSELKRISHNFNPLLLKSGKSKEEGEEGVKTEVETDNFQPPKKKLEIPFWKIEAGKKIKKAQMIIFFVGRESHTSSNIDWEIKTAMRHGKPIFTIKLNDNFELNKVLTVTNKFSGQNESYDKKYSFEEFKVLIKEYEGGDYKVFNQDIDAIDKSLLLEQYKVFLQTSEDLVSRRQNVNNFYITINSALIAAFGLVWALDILAVYKFFVGISLSAVGIILSVSWIKLLTSYGDLNSSKMKIINCIEKQLPASLYDAEWAALSDKLNKRKYVSFTNSEKRVPILFIVVYICVSICGIAFLF